MGESLYLGVSTGVFVAGLSESERQRRARSVREAIHSARLEGAEVSPETQADMREYVQGRISIEEGLDRLRQRIARHVDAEAESA